jgi:hypothetical protein
VIREISTNLAFILGQLRSVAPEAEIIVTGAWDIIGYIDLPFADPYIEELNTALANAAVVAGARFANPFPIFNPQGNLDHEKRTLCALILNCSTAEDGHPSDAGYRALADVVFRAFSPSA